MLDLPGTWTSWARISYSSAARSRRRTARRLIFWPWTGRATSSSSSSSGSARRIRGGQSARLRLLGRGGQPAATARGSVPRGVPRRPSGFAEEGAATGSSSLQARPQSEWIVQFLSAQYGPTSSLTTAVTATGNWSARSG